MLKNLDMFTTRMLIIALYSCVRTSYQRKSINRLYDTIRERELSSESVLTLKLLAESCSRIESLDPEFMERLASTVASKHDRPEKMSAKFSSQLLMSLTNKGLTDTKVLDFFVKAFFSNLANANGVDCTMVLLSLYREPLRVAYK